MSLRVQANKSAVQGALEWLEANQDKPLEELTAAGAGASGENDGDDDDADEVRANIAALESGVAKSLVCNECGKRFRNQDLASYHATKTYADSRFWRRVAYGGAAS